MATRGRDLDPDIRITFLGGTNNGEDGVSDLGKCAYEGDKGETLKRALWYLLPSSTRNANESLPYISCIASERDWAPYQKQS